MNQQDTEKQTSPEYGGVIWLAATPIGNPDDASIRLRHLLETADCIAAEDTRRLKSLCVRMGIRYQGDLLAVHDHNEADKSAELVERAQNGETVILVSDAGTPTVSDPGFRVTQAAIKAGVNVKPLPGPSAALAALSVSGLPSDRFAFEGFLPRKTGEARKRLEQVATDERTLIYFESPRRLTDTLQAMAAVLGEDRPVAVCRELTKTYEEVIRGTLSQVIDTLPEEVKGEITIVVGAAPKGQGTPADYAKEVLELSITQGIRLKDAAGQVAERVGLRRNELYQAVLELSL